MSTPANPSEFPAPHTSVAGTSLVAGKPLSEVAAAFVPKGTNLEQPGSTLSRLALRLLCRVTGRAMSVDELANAGTGVNKTTVAADALVIPTNFRYVAKTTGADGEALTLADGQFPGQRVNIRLVTDGGGDGTLTPASPLGFATIVFADAGDFAELEWTNDGTNDGWIIAGIGGLTAQPTVTAS